MAVQDVLLRSAALRGGEACLLADGRRWTYGEIAQRARRLATTLHERGVRQGDRVVIFMDNGIDPVVGLFGTLMAGGAMVIVHPVTPPEKLAQIVNNAGAKLVITTGRRLALAERSSAEWSPVVPIAIVHGPSTQSAPSLDGALDQSRDDGPFAVCSADDIAAIIYTSGSTGAPKGVTLTHGNIDFVVESVSEYLEHTASDRVLCLLQLAFGYGLLQLLVTFHSGGMLVLEKGFGMPFDIIRRVQQERITGMAGVPTLWAMLLQLTGLEGHETSSVRYLTNAAAGLPPAFAPKLRAAFPAAKLYLMHGMTECLRTTFLPPEELDRRPDSVGRGMRGVRLFVVDEDKHQLSNGSTGELAVQGPNLMRGYWRDPEGTAKVLHSDPDTNVLTLYSGDLFRTDEEGYLYFVARKDDVIKVRGEKVAPVEVENVIYTMPEVAEVRALGQPHPVLGMSLRAEIVLKEGMNLTEGAVKLHCRQHLEEYKIPAEVAFVVSLPKTVGGKIKRTTATPSH